ncbi:DHA2 family efflux MFS transporter permease subunit [Kribbella sandramycini]|uniref:DHA2 family efflux MFS transporter permease subunit n=1 Tax=Kribbella sandramycini TaxID=60450 RepID=A0A7Y4L1F7_9ACTN|nr:MFS transporter [Kribbella sandramycini]MBB6564841.1 EmrB/QacA subfamily drug resistance transporter [Kribbella sandramycini]NOL42539.1 DHA2 family efflux MFS transporter permease subunit [Kribbella sandramycini]
MSEDVVKGDRPVDAVAAGGGHGHKNLGIALALISMAQLMVVLDGTIVNIALPHIQTDLGFTDATLPWVVNAYALAFGGLLLLGGRMGDILGRRKVFIFGVVLFGLASFIGGIAQNETVLLASRILQGVAAAAASPNALALITTTFPAGKERNRAMAVYAAMSGAGAAVGLILGGALTEASWRWTFFINTPIGLIVAVLAFRFLGESARQTGKFDLPGAITGTLGLTGLVYGLTHAATDGWSDFWTLFFIIGGLALIAIFLLIEARSRHALMPFRILADRTRGVSFFVMLVVGAAMFSMFYFLGIYVQNIMGFSAIKTGFAFLPFSVGIVVAAQVASALIARMDPRWIAGAGGLFVAAGMFGFSRLEVDSAYLTHLLPFVLLLSFGMGLIFVPLTLTAVSGVADEDSGVGSAVLNTVQQIGGAVGLALLGTISTSAIKDRFAELAPGLQKAAEAGQSPQQLEVLQKQFTAVATTYGFTRAFLWSTFLALGSAIITLVALSVKHKDLAGDGKPAVHIG